jgi:hypothetical protein
LRSKATLGFFELLDGPMVGALDCGHVAPDVVKPCRFGVEGNDRIGSAAQHQEVFSFERPGALQAPESLGYLLDQNCLCNVGRPVRLAQSLEKGFVRVGIFSLDDELFSGEAVIR